MHTPRRMRGGGPTTSRREVGGRRRVVFWFTIVVAMVVVIIAAVGWANSKTHAKVLQYGQAKAKAYMEGLPLPTPPPSQLNQSFVVMVLTHPGDWLKILGFLAVVGILLFVVLWAQRRLI